MSTFNGIGGEVVDFPLIANRLREARHSAGLSQERVSEQLDINQSHLSNIECGRAHPTLKMLLRFCEIYHLDIDYFLWDQYDSNWKDKNDDLREISITMRRLTPHQRQAVKAVVQTFLHSDEVVAITPE